MLSQSKHREYLEKMLAQRLYKKFSAAEKEEEHRALIEAEVSKFTKKEPLTKESIK